MSPESQRIAIGEACGWTQGTTGLWKDPDRSGYYSLPRYTESLDAIHEAEKMLTGEQAWEYVQLLAPNGGWCATATQRAEAFLRTLNLWTE